MLAAAALAVATAAAAHAGAWFATPAKANEVLKKATLRPIGRYAGQVLKPAIAKCRGDATGRSTIRNGKRAYNHLLCAIVDQKQRTWTLTFHVTGVAAFATTAYVCVRGLGATACP